MPGENDLRSEIQSKILLDSQLAPDTGSDNMFHLWLLFFGSPCLARVHILSSSKEVSLSCTTSSPWFFCVWEGPAGDRACALRDQMANHGNTLCGKQERLEIRGNSSTCILEIRDPVLLDNGKWTCAISDEKMDTVKDYKMLDMVVEGKMNLTAMNNTKEVIEGDKVEVVCSVSGTYPPPHLAWSTPHPGILHTHPSEVLPTMSGVVTVQQRAYYRTRVGERVVNISCMARQGNITRRVRSIAIKVKKDKQVDMLENEEQNIDQLILK